LPADRADVANVATPSLSVPVPMGLPPSRKVTVPVGIPAPGATGDTVAVKVTDCPRTEAFADEVNAVVLPALLTTCGLPVSDPVLPLKFPLPP